MQSKNIAFAWKTIQNHLFVCHILKENFIAETAANIFLGLDRKYEILSWHVFGIFTISIFLSERLPHMSGCHYSYGSHTLGERKSSNLHANGVKRSPEIARVKC